MPRMCTILPARKLGECYPSKKDFMKGIKSMCNLAWKCRIKPISSSPKLMNLVLGIFGENAEVVAEWSRLFGPWKCE
nr:Nuclear pore complex protein NUP85 [Ipomoea batatas]